VVDVHHAGGLDRSSARAAWPAVLVDIKKAKPGRAGIFAAAEVEIDRDGETLVVEFPGDQPFSIQLAEEPEMRELLKRALSSALGFAPPVRFQLGKGAVRPAASAPEVPAPAPAQRPAPASDTSYDDEPVPEYYETGAGAVGEYESRPAAAASVASPIPAVAPAVAGQQSDLARLLTEGMGAQIVAQHAAQPDAVTPAAADDDEAAAELAAAGSSSYDEAGLFDSDPREDEAE
jgi:hypothetical protein